MISAMTHVVVLYVLASLDGERLTRAQVRRILIKTAKEYFSTLQTAGTKNPQRSMLA